MCQCQWQYLSKSLFKFKTHHHFHGRLGHEPSIRVTSVVEGLESNPLPRLRLTLTTNEDEVPISRTSLHGLHSLHQDPEQGREVTEGKEPSLPSVTLGLLRDLLDDPVQALLAARKATPFLVGLKTFANIKV